jgi:hypothetical protein
MSILSNTKRRAFNANNKQDVQEFIYFRKNNKWKNGCPFQLEYPFLDVVAMISSKLLDKFLHKIPEQV